MWRVVREIYTEKWTDIQVYTYRREVKSKLIPQADNGHTERGLYTDDKYTISQKYIQDITKQTSTLDNQTHTCVHIKKAAALIRQTNINQSKGTPPAQTGLKLIITRTSGKIGKIS